MTDEDFSAHYNEAPCGLASLLPNGTIIAVNETLLGWLGYEASALVRQKRFQDLLNVGDRIFFETHFSPLLQMQRSANEINFTIKRKDGSTFPALISATEVQDAAGKPLLIRMALVTITDRKKYESELLLARKNAEQALRAKADFVSLLTHEIRTPLNSIIGVSHLLASTELSTEQKQYSEMLASSSENLMSLLNSILDYSKIDSGKARVEERPFEFERTMRTTALAFQAPAMRKGIELRVEIAEAIPTVLCGDPVKIGQMVTNLVGNAIKFTEAGSVSLKIDLLNDTPHYTDLHFSVRDTGIGIAENIIPRIFEEYSQANSETGVTYGGTGLGLAIVQKLAALHGSKINVSSQLGVGSSFSFDLRLRHGTKSAAAGVEPKIDASLAGIRVLVADDSEDNQAILGLLLNQWGVIVTSALNGQEVLNEMNEHSFDLILMDLRMPILSGYATTAAIRKLADRKKAKIPIIAFSASATLGDQDIVSKLQFQDILGKPFKPNELFSKISAQVPEANRNNH